MPPLLNQAVHRFLVCTEPPQCLLDQVGLKFLCRCMRVLIPSSVPVEGDALQLKGAAVKVYYPNGQTTAIKVSTLLASTLCFEARS